MLHGGVISEARSESAMVKKANDRRRKTVRQSVCWNKSGNLYVFQLAFANREVWRRFKGFLASYGEAVQEPSGDFFRLANGGEYPSKAVDDGMVFFGVVHSMIADMGRHLGKQRSPAIKIRLENGTLVEFSVRFDDRPTRRKKARQRS